MSIKDVKVNFLKNKNATPSLEFNLKAGCLHGCGIYIFYSPSKNLSYVGKSICIYDRLKQHIKETFLSEVDYVCNSHKVLELDDVEMYCCFTQDTYDYDNVKDISKELSILESYIINVFLNAGIKLSNAQFPDYNIQDLDSIKFEDLNKSIDLKYDLFQFGLKEMLISKYYYSGSKYRYELEEMKLKKNKVELKIQELTKEKAQLKRDIFLIKQQTEDDIRRKNLGNDLAFSLMKFNYEKEIDEQKSVIENLKEKNLSFDKSVADDKKFIIKNIKKVFALESSVIEEFEVKEFVKLLKECEGFRDIKEMNGNIIEYINSLDCLSFDIKSEVLKLIRQRSELILLHLFKYRVTIKESKKEEVLNGLCDSLLNRMKEFCGKFII